MTPLVAIATLRAREGKEAQVRAAFAEMQGAVHEEQGCRLYALHTDREDPRTFVMIEIWDSEADIQRHLETPHVQALIARTDELFEGPAVIQMLDALPVGDSGKGKL
jgi:quinol monooxygenase YgiN